MTSAQLLRHMIQHGIQGPQTNQDGIMCAHIESYNHNARYERAQEQQLIGVREDYAIKRALNEVLRRNQGPQRIYLAVSVVTSPLSLSVKSH